MKTRMNDLNRTGTAAVDCPVQRSSTMKCHRTSTSRGCLLFAILAIFASRAFAQDLPTFRWENFTTSNGLPDNHVYCVLVNGQRIWAGTDNGLGLYENGTWKIFRPADG
ncbi:MAG: hypothetical protein ACM3WP_11075, partial [Acidobacteriota bacterium]